jgi:hypothetical protein
MESIPGKAGSAAVTLSEWTDGDHPIAGRDRLAGLGEAPDDESQRP